MELDHAVSGYAYVGNNPVRYIDPYGLWRETADGYETNDEDEIGALLDRIRRGDNMKEIIGDFNWASYDAWLIEIGFYDSPQGGGKGGGGGGGGGAGPWAGGVMPDGIIAYLQLNSCFNIAPISLLIDREGILEKDGLRINMAFIAVRNAIYINDARIRALGLNMYDIASMLRHEWKHVQDYRRNPDTFFDDRNNRFNEQRALFIQLFDPNIWKWSPQFRDEYSDLWNRWFY